MSYLRIGMKKLGCRLTVDCNGNALSQDVAIAAHKGGDSTQLVELLVVVADSFGWLSVDKIELEVVGLRNGKEGDGAWVALSKSRQHELFCMWILYKGGKP